MTENLKLKSGEDRRLRKGVSGDLLREQKYRTFYVAGRRTASIFETRPELSNPLHSRRAEGFFS